MGTGSFSGAWADFLKHIPYGLMPCSNFMRGEELGPASTEGTRLCQLPMEGLTVSVECLRVNGGVWEGEVGKRRERENCGWHVI